MRTKTQSCIGRVAAVLLLCFGLSGCGKRSDPAVTEPDKAVLDQIHSNTRLLIEGMREEHNITLRLDGDSIQWLDSYINDQRDLITKELRDQMIEGFGCFLGDSIVEVYGGRWIKHESQGMCIKLKNEAIALPFPAVARQFTPGNASSIYVMFAMVPELIEKEPSDTP
jgi:hypothetical protein